MTVINEIKAERERQIAAEGWTPEHDDQHDQRQLAAASEAYVLTATHTSQVREWCYGEGEPPSFWPFAPEYWKPTNPRRDLIKAAALIVAEIERLDRLGGQNDV